MSFTLFKTRIYISYLFAAWLTLIAFWENGRGVMLCLLFSLFHECGHIAAMILCGAHIEEIRFEAFGICIQCDDLAELSLTRRIFVLSGGCAVNLALAIILHQSPVLCALNVGLLIFNLLPVGWLDGGRIIHTVLSYTMGEKRGDILHSIVSFVLLLPLTAFGVYSVITSRNLSLLLVCAYLGLTLVFKQKRIYKIEVEKWGRVCYNKHN